MRGRADINTAFLLDRCPRFPSPDDILSTTNFQPLLSLSRPTILQSCLTDEMSNAVMELLTFNQFLARELTVRDIWEDDVFAELNLIPVLSKLLSIRLESAEHDSAFARQEACKIGAILYIAGIRARFGVKLATNVYIPKLKDSIVAQADSNLEKPVPFLSWVLMIGGVQSFMHEEHEWFVSTIANIAVSKRYSMWEELMADVRGILWIDGMLEAECSKFRGEVSRELWTSYRVIIL